MTAKLLGWFPCRETSGNILHDSVTDGLIWDISDRGDTLVYATPTDGIGCTSVSEAPVNFQGGSSPTIRTDRDYLYFCAGRLTGLHPFRCSVGDINEILPEYAGIGAGYGASDGVFHALVGSGDDFVRVIESSNAALYTQAVPTPFDVCIVERYSGINNTILYEAYNAATGVKVLEALTYTDTDIIGDVTPNPCFRFIGIELYGVMLIEFTEFPDDTITGALSMAAQWRLGKSTRTVYAPWFPRPVCGLCMQ